MLNISMPSFRIPKREPPPTPQRLHMAIINNDWDEAHSLLMIGKHCCRKRTECPSFFGEPSEILAIHQACSMIDVPLSFIKALYVAYPESLKKTDTTWKRIPLHIAVKCNTSIEIVLFLLQSWPEAVEEQDMMGRLPLHYALSNHASSVIIHHLIAPCPDTVSEADEDGRTPLHVAALKAVSPEIISILVGFKPEAVFMRTSNGSTPSKCVMDSRNTNKESVLSVLRAVEGKLQSNPVFFNLQESQLRGKVRVAESSYDINSEVLWVRKQLSSDTSSLL